MSRGVTAVNRKWTARVLSALVVWGALVTAARALGNQPRVGLLALVVATLGLPRRVHPGQPDGLGPSHRRAHPTAR